MNLKPNIRSRFGPFTTRGFNKLTRKVNEVDGRDLSGDPMKRNRVFVAQIVAATSVISGRRWKYEWAAAELKTDFTFAAISGSQLTYAVTAVYAYNTIEALQQSSGTYDGPGLTHANIPSGYTLQPIAVDTMVHMLMSRGQDGILSFTFSVANAIDGECA